MTSSRDNTRFSAKKNLDRRHFIGICGAAVFAPSFKPLLRRPPNDVPLGRVVMVRNPDATSYGFGEGESYGDAIDQTAVDRMADEGVMTLTGADSVKAAWRAVLPNFANGQRVAIKVNFNNSEPYYNIWDEPPYLMNGLIQTVNAIVRGLKLIGVREEDVWVYDSVRSLSRYFIENCLFPGVRFWDLTGSHGKSRAHHGTNVRVAFSRSEVPTQSICNVVTETDWLINVPLLKRHRNAGITLSFKNHFGTIHDCSMLHNWVFPVAYGNTWTRDYNPLVDIALNNHIRNKTVLVVGDCLFGNHQDLDQPPIPWQTFNGGSPNSLLFSRDMVAIDSVMHDILLMESEDPFNGAGAYLPLAEAEGLGVFEHGDPRSSDGYERIDYTRFDQQGSGDAIWGVVRSKKQPIAGALVTAVHQGDGGKQKTRTTSDGSYSFARMRPGSYKLTVKKKRFKSKSRGTSYTGKLLRRNFKLRPK